MARELSTDPYVPATGSLPPDATEEQAMAWVLRQRQRHASGAGYSTTIVDRERDEPVGHGGLWFPGGTLRHASVGYGIVPSARGRGFARDALHALTDLAWSIPGLEVVEAFIEPDNAASIAVAERVDYARGALLRERQTIGGRRRDVLRYWQERPAETAPPSGTMSA